MAKNKSAKRTSPNTPRYILLPPNRLQATGVDSNPDVANFLIGLTQNVAETSSMQLAIKRAPGVAAGTGAKSSIQINVLDSIHENGAKLVVINNKEMAYFRFSYPGLRIIPEKFYDLAFRQEMIDEGATASATRRTVGLTARIECLDQNGDPVKDVTIVAFTDFAARAGASGTTNSSGIVNLTLPGKKIERMYAYPIHSSWGFFQQTFTMPAKLSITLQSIQPGSTDGLRHFYPTRSWPAVTARVRVGIIDTGFGPHKDITIHSAVNMVSGEDPADFRDRNGHGTHVAGIIGAKGDFTGVANGVELCIYRVFPFNKRASTFDIMKAIDRAKQDGCDLVNMSLSQSFFDEGIVSSIKDAYEAGMLCFAANGNDDRSPVSFPASYSLSISVSAMGRQGTFPKASFSGASAAKPVGKDKKNFIASFSNIGVETDLTGPGVGIISTWPGDNFAVLDGTSMACPAQTGMAARLLAEQATIMGMPRNAARTDAMQKFLSTKIKTLGFGANFEGKGMLFP